MEQKNICLFDKKKPIVISLGGSVVYPDKLDTKFVSEFEAFIRSFVKQGYKFIIVVGGGRLARDFQAAAGKLSKLTDYDSDWLGIHATRLNAQLLRTVFADICDHVIIDGPKKIGKMKHPIVFGAGWRPGWSTDYVAVSIAHAHEAPVVNMGTADHVYSRDPKKYSSAKKFEFLKWKEYRKLIPRAWKPGLGTPVDPIAAGLAEESKLTAYIVDGRDLKNLANLLRCKQWVGTTITA
jgi:uridylate kinase